MPKNNNLRDIAKLLRYYIITSTNKAGSGHPTSSLSSVELITVLFFGGFFNTNLDNFEDVYTNDRLIFSKGHASPLFYSLYTALGAVSYSELMTYRQFGSRLEGHPTLNFPFTEVPTGSLGQGLGVGVGQALFAQLAGLDYQTFVLMGDGELAEGSVWEALAIASKYNLKNLVVLVDVNRLGQSGPTLHGHDLTVLQSKFSSFGWSVSTVDGHCVERIQIALDKAKVSDRPMVILAKTIKGKGVSLAENQEGFHGKVFSDEQMQEILKDFVDIQKVQDRMPEIVQKLSNIQINFGYIQNRTRSEPNLNVYQTSLQYQGGKKISTRKAFGFVLEELGHLNSNVVVLDAETNGSTFTSYFKEAFPDRFLEMFIAEQNMVSVGTGLAKRGATVFMATFGAFLTRAFDQLRMAQYSGVQLNIIGSHCGVSIGEDGASQMALEDIAMIRTLSNSIILYPSDAVSSTKLTHLLAGNFGLNYLRTTREDLPVLYDNSEEFYIGGSKILYRGNQDKVVLVGAGITVHECQKAADDLLLEKIFVSVLDLYSIKPLDKETLLELSKNNHKILVVEDHRQEGGIYSAICEALADNQDLQIYSLAVKKTPISGTSQECLGYCDIDKKAIISKVKKIIS